MSILENHRNVQCIAKAVLLELAATIGPADTESSIADRAVYLLRAHDVSQTWYYDCPALVLLGTRSCLSVSGRDYQPANEPVGLMNLVTVDLSPSRFGAWGDCARSLFVENGQCVESPQLPEFQRGVATLNFLHENIRDFVTLETTCVELFEFANATIAEMGFENLDFLGNVGHSIESQLEHRRFIETGNRMRIRDIGLFTFEPHIRERGGRWGFKHENIYQFGTSGRIEEL